MIYVGDHLIALETTHFSDGSIELENTIVEVTTDTVYHYNIFASKYTKVNDVVVG